MTIGDLISWLLPLTAALSFGCFAAFLHMEIGMSDEEAKKTKWFVIIPATLCFLMQLCGFERLMFAIKTVIEIRIW